MTVTCQKNTLTDLFSCSKTSRRVDADSQLSFTTQDWSMNWSMGVISESGVLLKPSEMSVLSSGKWGDESGGIERTAWFLVPTLLRHNMDAVSWFLKTPPNPRSPGRSSDMSGTSTVSRLSSLFLRSSVRRSGPSETPQQVPSRNVSWNTHVEVFVIPAREAASNDCDPRVESTAGGCEKDDDIDPHRVIPAKGLHGPNDRAQHGRSDRDDR